jgi:hypothetical protein
MSFLLVACAAPAGCGAGGATDNLPRLPVSGTVTLDGAPLAKGMIQFMPTSAQQGVVAGAMIEDGKYSIPRDQGPVPGSYAVSIVSGGSSESPPGPPGPPVEGVAGPPEMVPEKYNTKTILSVRVEADKPCTFNFAMQK